MASDGFLGVLDFVLRKLGGRVKDCSGVITWMLLQMFAFEKRPSMHSAPGTRGEVVIAEGLFVFLFQKSKHKCVIEFILLFLDATRHVFGGNVLEMELLGIHICVLLGMETFVWI